MAKDAERPKWEQQVHDAGTQIEEEVRRLVRRFNDEIVPEIRRNGSDALRAAAEELNRLAQRMDERAGRTPPPPPPAGGNPRS
jgi:hypothetical protein